MRASSPTWGDQENIPLTSCLGPSFMMCRLYLSKVSKALTISGEIGRAAEHRYKLPATYYERHFAAPALHRAINPFGDSGGICHLHSTAPDS